MHPVNGDAGPLRGARAVVLLVVLGVALFGWRLGGHDLWPTDEPRFGLVAKEMHESGDPVLLSRNGRLYVEKPPLFIWAINAAAALTGSVDERAARLPSVVSAVLAMLLILRLGGRLYDRTTGLIGAVVFATSLQILERARWASIDMTLNLFVLLAIALLLRAAEDGGRWWARGAWAAMGLATLAKGPVGLVLPLIATVPAVLWLRGGRAAARLAPPSGLALYLAVTLAWFGPFAARLGPDRAVEILTKETVERYVDAWNNRHPAWFYLWNFPAGFFPWSVLLPGAIAAGGPPTPAARPSDARSRERTAGIVLALWMTAILVFFSFSTGKRGVYIIPAYPAAALLVARLFVRAGTAEGAASGALRSAGAVLAVLSALAAVAAGLLLPRRHPELAVAAGFAAALVAAGGLAAGWLARRGRALAAAGALAAAMGGLLLVGTEMVFPWANGYLNLRGFATGAAALYRTEIPIAATREKREAWVFYGGRTVQPVDTAAEVIAWMSGPAPRDLLIDEDLYEEVRAALPGDVVEVYAGRVSRQTCRLLRRPAPGGPS
jgi:4-amino-4-deoxy-L-arabinose transferase-like glycosyltransferase